jgi:hypothetical protein
MCTNFDIEISQNENSKNISFIAQSKEPVLEISKANETT